MSLVLTRAKGTAFSVDGPAKITVLKIKGGNVQVAIEAPPSTTIMRDDAKHRLEGADCKP